MKKIEHPSFNVKVLMNKFVEFACGTCLKSRLLVEISSYRMG